MKDENVGRWSSFHFRSRIHRIRLIHVVISAQVKILFQIFISLHFCVCVCVREWSAESNLKAFSHTNSDARRTWIHEKGQNLCCIFNEIIITAKKVRIACVQVWVFYSWKLGALDWKCFSLKHSFSMYSKRWNLFCT